MTHDDSISNSCLSGFDLDVGATVLCRRHSLAHWRVVRLEVSGVPCVWFGDLLGCMIGGM